MINRALFRTTAISKIISRGISLESIDPRIIKAEYAVRGAVVNKAMEIEKKILGGEQFPFNKLIYCNIGNPQSLNQQPLSYLRQILAILDYPELLNQKYIFPEDIHRRALSYLNNIPGGTGAYSNSQGVEMIRKEISEYIFKRDGYPSDYRHIYLTDGASTAIKYIMSLLISHNNDGVLLPIPQYPLYSATLSLLGGATVPYYLNEETGWSIDINEISKTLDEHKKKGINVRGLVVINPGNPTGQCLDPENMREILLFCSRNKLTLLADEVYQDNIYTVKKKFTSFKKIYSEMSETVKDLELASFHSTSKGFYGQVAMGVVCNPPKPGEESYQQYYYEKNLILDSLKRRAQLLQNALNSIHGISCQPIEGALYAFPKIIIPDKAIKEANNLKISPDLLYCLKLLDNTGIVTVPGSGFLQRDGTYHYRTTILPPEEDMNQVIRRLKKFHEEFNEQYN